MTGSALRYWTFRLIGLEAAPASQGRVREGRASLLSSSSSTSGFFPSFFQVFFFIFSSLVFKIRFKGFSIPSRSQNVLKIIQNTVTIALLLRCVSEVVFINFFKEKRYPSKLKSIVFPLFFNVFLTFVVFPSSLFCFPVGIVFALILLSKIDKNCKKTIKQLIQKQIDILLNFYHNLEPFRAHFGSTLGQFGVTLGGQVEQISVTFSS